MEFLVPCSAPLQVLVGFLQLPPPKPSLGAGRCLGTGAPCGVCGSSPLSFERSRSSARKITSTLPNGRTGAHSVHRDGEGAGLVRSEEKENGAKLFLEGHRRQQTQGTAREILPRY